MVGPKESAQRTSSSTESLARVGVLGWGRMGSAIGGLLQEAGHRVCAFDSSESARGSAETAGVQVLPSPQALAAEADLVLILVADDDQVLDVAFGPGGLQESETSGYDVGILSSVKPTTCAELARKLANAGGVFDAAMVGGEQKTAQGMLILFCGGEIDVIDRWSQTFKPFATQVCHVGPLGSGQLAKAMNNALMTAALAVDIEVQSVAVAAGLDPAKLRPILGLGTGANRVLADWGMHRLRFVEKDVGNFLELAQELGVEVPVFTELRSQVSRLSVETIHKLR